MHFQQTGGGQKCSSWFCLKRCIHVGKMPLTDIYRTSGLGEKRFSSPLFMLVCHFKWKQQGWNMPESLSYFLQNLKYFSEEWFSPLFKKKKLINLFIFGCAGSLLLHGLFSSCGKPDFTLRCGVWVSPCSDFPYCRTGALDQRLSNCGHGLSCPLACGIFPEQGLNPCPCTGRRILIHCTTREVFPPLFLMTLYFSWKTENNDFIS